jgi:uncharacterized protein (TIGR02246 family)
MKKSAGQGFTSSARGLIQGYADSILHSDADANAALWDDEGISMPPDSPMVRGRPSIHEMFRAAFSHATYTRFDCDLDEITDAGEYGFVRGNYTYAFHPGDGQVVIEREGKFLTILRRQSDGSWRLYIDCFNLNARAG